MKSVVPHSVSADTFIDSVESNAMYGLSVKEAKLRLESAGYNRIEEKDKKTAFAILLNQLKEIMVIILFIAGFISLFLHEQIDAVVIFSIIILNTILGFWQELKAEKAMQALKKMSVPNVRVRRDGKESLVSAEEVVPGDILLVEAGNIIPADCRLLEAVNLKVQEAALTGESEPVEKSVNPVPENVALGDRKNMIFRGTVVTYGRGSGVVSATGMKTEIGKIADMLQNVREERTPLQKRLNDLGKKLALIAMFLVAIVAGIAFFTSEDLKSVFLTAVSMAVAAIPEGLPAIVTISLALGAKRMLKHQALIRHLPAVETLGSITVICSDKTGTLTQNRMTVKKFLLNNEMVEADDCRQESLSNDLKFILSAGALCTDSVLAENGKEAIGDPTEGALVLAAARFGLSKDDLLKSLPRKAEYPFDSDRKRMTTLHEIKNIPDFFQKSMLLDAVIAFTKGSPDGIVEISSRILENSEVNELSEEKKALLLKHNEDLASEGIRTLGFAFRSVSEKALSDPLHYENDLIFVGIMGMIDPVRPEAVDAVTSCKTAGIRPIMITGDHPLTALSIAAQLGIGENREYIRGEELSQISDMELKKKVRTCSVYARVAPEHKMNIIDALQSNGEIVSMTGDGVNDAPALKSADIGVAMGITGTDVSKESSDIVLLDDNFATIVRAVKEGRTIFDNIRKFIKYILTGNTGEILAMLTGPFFGMGIPLLPIHILWINLVTDGLPAIALGYEPSEKNVMNRPPYKPSEGIFSRGLGRKVLVTGFIVGLISILSGYIVRISSAEMGQWRTAVFTTLTFCQMAFALACQSNTKSMFAVNPINNPVMVAGIFLTLALQMIIVYVPFVQNIFKTAALEPSQLIICITGAALIICYTEIEKLIIYLLSRSHTTIQSTR